MGYDVHITRADDYTESENHPIALDEWTFYVRSDPEMRLDGIAEATIQSGETLTYRNPGLAVWVKYSGHGLNGNMAWFDYYNGEIVVKNPDHEILLKMYQIATVLGAKVQGDDGEVYDEEGRAE